MAARGRGAAPALPLDAGPGPGSDPAAAALPHPHHRLGQPLLAHGGRGDVRHLGLPPNLGTGGQQGYSATRSGASLLWLSIGWPLAAVLGSRLIVRMGVRPSALLGLGLNVAGSAGLVALARTMAEIPEILLAVVTFVIGAGMGFSTLAFILGIQSSVDWAQRGVATASFQFIRTLGGMIWVSAMGGVMNVDLLGRLQRIPGVAAWTTAEAGRGRTGCWTPRAGRPGPESAGGDAGRPCGGPAQRAPGHAARRAA